MATRAHVLAYEHALDSGRILVCQLEASGATRRARIEAHNRRTGLAWHLARTAELQTVLDVDGYRGSIMVGIKDAHLLATCFGRWPDFRDAEVSGIRLFAIPDRPAELELDIEVVELFRDRHGIDRDRQRCLTTFRFANVLGAQIEALLRLRHKPLNGLAFLEREGSPPADEWGGRQYRVRLVPVSHSFEVQFFCDEVAISKSLSISRAI